MDFIQKMIIEGKNIEKGKSKIERQKGGVFYTPHDIIRYMVNELFSNINVDCDFKILDPSCGAGFFLFGIIDFFQNKGFDIDYIINNNLFGVDIDTEAVERTKSAICTLSKNSCNPNILFGDMLLYDEYKLFSDRSFDFIIGNPPYIGHKKADKDYKKRLKALYEGIYIDKSDISYCFIKRSIDLLKIGGVLSFITSRYFIEGPSARGLRKYINENCTVVEIFDFGGYAVFSDAGVNTCIITLKKEKSQHKTVIKRLNGNSLKDADSYVISNEQLKDEGWLLLSKDKLSIYNKIEKFGTHTLSQLFESFQGIITGCDRAFVLNKRQIIDYNIESELIRPWIKNSDIIKYKIKEPSLYLIYSNNIDNTVNYPNAVSHIRKYIDRLQNRRECKNGIREWYELQWGRKTEVFESPKIVYPYKSAKSRFAVDRGGLFCSADVYSLLPKKSMIDESLLEYFSVILNSKLFEFYFKCFAKKISENLYDYYPNTVLRMKLNILDINSNILSLANEVISCKNEAEREMHTKRIDEIIYSEYELTDEEIRIIEGEIDV